MSRPAPESNRPNSTGSSKRQPGDKRVGDKTGNKGSTAVSKRNRRRRLLGSRFLGDRVALIRMSLARMTRSKSLVPWNKKRGSRILGGRLTGVVGEAMFYASLFLVGVFGISLVLINRFAPAGIPFSADQLPPALSPALSTPLSTWIMGVLSIAAIVSGGASLWFRLMRLGASNEYRNMLANRAGKIEQDAIDWIGPKSNFSLSEESSKLPNVPPARQLTESPGERLAFRLAADTSETGIAGPATLTLLWNSAWLVLLAVAISGFWYGNPRWILTCLLLPFALVGYWSLKFFLGHLRQIAGVGPTIVEISQQPLVSGEPFELFVLQSGRLKLKRLDVQLICEEESFYRQGTDIRVDRHQAFMKVLCAERSVTIDPRGAWEQQLSLTFPEGVMHSFVGTHNAIRWKIVVHGVAKPWPSFYRNFPIVVHPPSSPLKLSPR